MSTTKRVGRFERGTKSIDHDVFKLAVEKMKKNQSWVFRKPDIVLVEHVHFFHSINDTTLQPNKYSTPTGGHFHEVTAVWEGEGDNRTLKEVKCGPPLHFVTRKVANGRTVRRVMPVEYETFVETGDDVGNITKIVDGHRHELAYMGSETFTEKTKSNLRQEEQRKVAAAMSGPPSRQPAAMQGLTTGPEHDKQKGNLKEGGERTQEGQQQ